MKMFHFASPYLSYTDAVSGRSQFGYLDHNVYSPHNALPASQDASLLLKNSPQYTSPYAAVEGTASASPLAGSPPVPPAITSPVPFFPPPGLNTPTVLFGNAQHGYAGHTENSAHQVQLASQTEALPLQTPTQHPGESTTMGPAASSAGSPPSLQVAAPSPSITESASPSPAPSLTLHHAMPVSHSPHVAPLHRPAVTPDSSQSSTLVPLQYSMFTFPSITVVQPAALASPDGNPFATCPPKSPKKKRKSKKKSAKRAANPNGGKMSYLSITLLVLMLILYARS
jgi:hypothetical protein